MWRIITIYLLVCIVFLGVIVAERINAAQRVKIANVAEQEILKFKNDHALWHKHIHGVELDPMQVLKCIEMDQYNNTIDYSCRRTGKTAVKELRELKEMACDGDQELGIVAPREAQSQVNLGYHLEAIDRSEILTAFIRYKNGRKQKTDSYYQFQNKSIARCYGIMSQIDGGDLTSASLEEVDDMPAERLTSRFLLTMGSNRRLGASKTSKNEPTIRITGVFKGADTLADLIESGRYHVLPIVDVYLGMEMKVINETFMNDMRAQLAPDEYIRQLLCRNVSARNLIWEKYARRAMMVGLKAPINIEQPLPGVRYKKRGLISFGYDHSGHGETPESSKYALTVWEQIGNFSCCIFAKTWAPGMDEQVVKNDLKAFWRYFNPDYAMGDAFGIGLLTQLNDELYRECLTDVDRMAVGDGQSTATNWVDWAFAPIRFEGMVKHSMAQGLRSIFHNGQAALPYTDDDPDNPDHTDMRLLAAQLVNIKQEATQVSYSKYKMVNKKIGDDLFDAAMAGVWALQMRGAAPMPTVIDVYTTSRDKLLGRG